MVVKSVSPNVLQNELPVGKYSYTGSLYFFCYLTQQATIFGIWLYVLGVDMIYIGACVMVATQFKIASNVLKEMKHDVMVLVKTFVEHHNMLYRFV